MFFEVVQSDTAIPDAQRKAAKLDGLSAKALAVISNEQPSVAVAAASLCSTWHIATVTNQFHVTVESRGQHSQTSTITSAPLTTEKPHELKSEALVFPCRNASSIALRHHLVALAGSATNSATTRTTTPATLSEASLADLVASDVTIIASTASAWTRPADRHQPTWPRIVNAAHLPTIALLAHVKRDSRRVLLVLTPYDPTRSSGVQEQSMAALYNQQQSQMLLNQSATTAHHADPNHTLQNISAIGAANQSLLDRNPVVPEWPASGTGGNNSRNGGGGGGGEPSLVAALDDSKASSAVDGQRRPMGIVYTLSACQVSSAARFVTVSHGGEWVAVMEPKTCLGTSMAGICPLVLDPSRELRVVPCALAPTSATGDDRVEADPNVTTSPTLIWTSIVPQFSHRVRIGRNLAVAVPGDDRSDAAGDSGTFFLASLFSDGCVRVYAALRSKQEALQRRNSGSGDGDGRGGDAAIYSPTSGEMAGGEESETLTFHAVACTHIIENSAVTTAGSVPSNPQAGSSRLRDRGTARLPPSVSKVRAPAGGSSGGGGRSAALSLDAARVVRCPSGEVLCCVVPAGVVFVAIAHNLPTTFVSLPRPPFVVGKQDTLIVDEIVWAGHELSSGVLVRVKAKSAQDAVPQNHTYLCWAGPAGQSVVVQARPFYLPRQFQHFETPILLPSTGAAGSSTTRAASSAANPRMDAVRDGHFLAGEHVAGCTRFRVHVPDAPDSPSAWVDVLVSRCPSVAAQCEFALLSRPPASIAAFITLVTFAGISSLRRSLMAQLVFTMLALDSNRFLEAAVVACRAYGAAILGACPPNGTQGLSTTVSSHALQLMTAASDEPTATSAVGQDMEVLEGVVEHLAAHGAVSALLSSVCGILVPPLVGTREVIMIADTAIVGLGSVYASSVAVDSDVQVIRSCASQTLQLALTWRQTHEDRLAALGEADASKSAASSVGGTNVVAHPTIRGLEVVEAEFLALADGARTAAAATAATGQPPKAVKPLLASDWELLWPLLLIRHGTARTLELVDQASLAMRQFNDDNSVAVQQLLMQCKTAIW